VSGKPEDEGTRKPVGSGLHLREKQIARLLLDNGANVNAVDDQEKTPLDLAETEETKALLREHGGLSGEELKNQEEGED